MCWFSVVFVFTVLTPSTFADLEFLKPRYPGLTRPEARCPESAADEDYWYVAPINNDLHDTLFCFGLRKLSSNIRTFEDVEAACREKHENAVPARLYNYQKSNTFPRGFLSKNTIFGAYYTDNGDKDAINSTMSTDNYAIYYHNDEVMAVGIAAFSAEPTAKFILCMTPAYPRFMHSYYNKPIRTYPDLAEYTCEGDGWDLQAFCGHAPFCYKTIDVSPFPTGIRQMSTEFNVCGMKEPNSYVASVHCKDEYDYINRNSLAPTRLGQYLPHRGPWNKFDSWQNVDGTPVDSITWSIKEPNNCQNYIEKNVLSNSGYELFDFNPKVTNVHFFMCKKQAIKKRLPLDVKINDIFKVKGKLCLFERQTQWNRRCPTNSSLWQLVESDAGVYCYALVNVPAPFSTDSFNHEICHNLHPQAKLASFHHDRQFSFLYPLTGNANKVIVGLVPTNETFVWADGTAVTKPFWGPTEPSLNTSNTIVRIQNTKLKTPIFACSSGLHERPLFTTMKIEDVTVDMKVACKIKAEPLLPCAPLPDADGMESLDNTECPDGWLKLRFCDKVFCYKNVSVPNDAQNFAETIEHDYCHALEPKSHLASIHCIEEHFFVQGYPPKTLIGLHIPAKFHDDAFDVKNFEWTDDTPLDFVGWNQFSWPETTDMKYAPLFPTEVSENIKFSQIYNKFDDFKSGWSNQFSGFSNVLCKTKATLKKNY